MANSASKAHFIPHRSQSRSKRPRRSSLAEPKSPSKPSDLICLHAVEKTRSTRRRHNHRANAELFRRLCGIYSIDFRESDTFTGTVSCQSSDSPPGREKSKDIRVCRLASLETDASLQTHLREAKVVLVVYHLNDHTKIESEQELLKLDGSDVCPLATLCLVGIRESSSDNEQYDSPQCHVESFPTFTIKSDDDLRQLLPNLGEQFLLR